MRIGMVNGVIAKVPTSYTMYVATWWRAIVPSPCYWSPISLRGEARQRAVLLCGACGDGGAEIRLQKASKQPQMGVDSIASWIHALHFASLTLCNTRRTVIDDQQLRDVTAIRLSSGNTHECRCTVCCLSCCRACVPVAHRKFDRVSDRKSLSRSQAPRHAGGSYA